MDDLLVTLPCGFKSKYHEIVGIEDKFVCPVCKCHIISTDECLNMTRNKLTINQTKFDLKQQSLLEKLKKLEYFKIDPSFHIDENYSQLINQIDLRREEIKILINKKIDDYCENLLAQIDKEKETKLNEFKQKIEEIDQESDVLKSNNIPINLDINSKLSLIDEKLENLDKKINDIDKTIAILEEKCLVLNQSSQSWDVEKIFGELGPQLEFNPANDVIQSETTFRHLVNNFSKFKEGKILETYSKPVKVRNFEWSIHLKQSEQISEKMALECFLKCGFLSKQNELPLNLAAEIRLLNQRHPHKKLLYKIENLIKSEEEFYGYSYLVSIDEILDPDKGFYNISADTIIIEAWVKQSFRSSEVKNECDNVYNFKNGYLTIEDSDSFEDIDSDNSGDPDTESDSGDPDTESDSGDPDTESDSGDFDSDSDYSDLDSNNYD